MVNQMEKQGIELSKSDIVNKEGAQASSLFSREWQTVAVGLADGIGKTGSRTVEDLKQAGKDFSENPLHATAKYLENHWTDAAAGAAITFLRPTKWANAALLAYSLRGGAAATYDTLVGAMDPKADLNKLRSNYSDEISQQGTAFISSMPMALLGGNVGKAGAGAVFGKGMGALDLLDGKVSLTQVKQNLWELHDAIKPPPVKLVVTDMDNTLASHAHYFSEGIKTAITDISAKTSIPESELYTSIGNQMEKYRSHDYPWSLEIALKDRLKIGEPGGMSPADFEKNIAKPFWDTIDQSLKDNHHPYPGVRETLDELQRRKIPVAVLSDAPAFIGLRRLSNLGLKDGAVERFYGLHNWEEPPGLSKELLQPGRDRVEALLKTENSLKEFRALPSQWEKPETGGFQALMRHYDVRPSETLMIGDSRVKDVGLAYKSGARAIWASYGQIPAAEEAVLTRLRPIPENNGGVDSKGAAPPKTYAPYLEAAGSYDRLLAHLNPEANYSELGVQAYRSLMVRPDLKAALGAYAWSQPK